MKALTILFVSLTLVGCNAQNSKTEKDPGASVQTGTISEGLTNSNQSIAIPKAENGANF